MSRNPVVGFLELTHTDREKYFVQFERVCNSLKASLGHMFRSLLIRSLLSLIMIGVQGCETPQPTPSALTHSPPMAGLQESDVWSGGFWDPSYFQAKQIWGYVNKHSIVPGEVFDLMLSTRSFPGAGPSSPSEPRNTSSGVIAR